ncbi:hypothetical protein ACP275_10G083200 [Erythranthe tilingii]
MADRVSSLKERIERDENIRQDLQLLECDTIEMEDHLCLHEYPMFHDGWLVLTIALCIVVITLTGEEFHFKLDLETSVLWLKKWFEEKKGFLIENQILIHNGNVLEDGNSLSSSQIRGGSSLKLIIRLDAGI